MGEHAAPKPIERPEIRMNDQNWLSVQKYRGKEMLKKGYGVVGPAGVVIDGRPWRGFKHSVNLQQYAMNSPTALLKDANPECRYVWRPVDDPKHTTDGLVNTGKISPVEFDRVNLDSELASFVYDYSGTGPEGGVTGLVACGGFRLFEVRPDIAYQWFGEPVDRTFSRLAGLEQEFSDNAEAAFSRAGLEHRGSHIDVSDRASVEQESRKPRTAGAQAQVIGGG